MTEIIQETLAQRWKQFKQDNPNMRIRDAAIALNVSEAELVETGIGITAIRLNTQWDTMLLDFESLGRVMALTRNNDVVHERHGVYQHAEVMEGHGRVALVLDTEIDLRIFFRRWHFGFAVTEEARGNARQSLQFFDKDGTAVHKVYLTDQSNKEAYRAFVDKYQHQDQMTPLVTKPTETRRFGKSDELIDVKALQDGWDALKDTHDFFPLIQNLKVDRVQALRLAGETRAYRLTKNAVRTLLQKSAESQLDIMVFVGSAGVIQIHTGKVNHLKAFGDWYNVLDPDFNLHIRETGIDSIWLVKKPTEDGQVTSVECYDEQGNQLVQFFGKRKPGIPELDAWRALAEGLEPC